MDALKDPVAKVRRNAATSLGAFHPEAKQILPALLGLLNDGDVDVRRATIVSLGMLGQGSEDAEKAVTQYLKDPDPSTRMDAVVAAAAMGKRDDSVIPMLVDALGSKEEATAKAARRALTEMGVERAEKVVPALVGTLDKEGDPRTVNAVRVLAGMRSNAAHTAPEIAQAYGKVAPEQRHFVVDALLAVDSSGEQAIPILKKSLEAPDSLDRKEALLGLMRFRSNMPAILPAIIKAFNDEDEENRLIAVSIVRGLGDKAKDALPELIPMTKSQDLKIRKAAVGAIGNMHPDSAEAIAALEETLADQDVGMRLATVYAFKRILNVAPAETRDRVRNILQASLQRETNQNLKQTLRAALLPPYKPAQAEQHSKLNESENLHKTEQGTAKSEKAPQ